MIAMMSFIDGGPSLRVASRRQRNMKTGREAHHYLSAYGQRAMFKNYAKCRNLRQREITFSRPAPAVYRQPASIEKSATAP
jgi:hypothetical protein